MEAGLDPMSHRKTFKTLWQICNSGWSLWPQHRREIGEGQDWKPAMRLSQSLVILTIELSREMLFFDLWLLIIPGKANRPRKSTSKPSLISEL